MRHYRIKTYKTLHVSGWPDLVLTRVKIKGQLARHPAAKLQATRVYKLAFGIQRVFLVAKAKLQNRVHFHHKIAVVVREQVGFARVEIMKDWLFASRRRVPAPFLVVDAQQRMFCRSTLLQLI